MWADENAVIYAIFYHYCVGREINPYFLASLTHTESRNKVILTHLL